MLGNRNRYRHDNVRASPPILLKTWLGEWGGPGPAPLGFYLAGETPPVIPAKRTWGKKSITHIPRKINSLKFDSNAMKTQFIPPRINFKILHSTFQT